MNLKEELQRQWDRQQGVYKMKVYVAGSYQFRTKIDQLVDLIKFDIPDFECTSTWLRQGEEDDELEKRGHQHFIDLDMADIERCDVFLLINEPSVSKDSTGKWVELGLAMAMNKMIIVWGEAQDSLFLHGNTVVQVRSSSVEELVSCISIVNKVRKELYANRSIGSRQGLGIQGRASQRNPQDGGEALRAGIRPEEGSPLHELDRAFEGRTQGLGSSQRRAGEATPPHGPSVVK